MRGALIDCEETVRDGRLAYRITYEVDPREVSELPEDAEIVIRKYRHPRNANQNSLYWDSVRDLSHRMGCSVTECHNIMLDRYGEFAKDANGEYIPVLKSPDFDWTRSETEHFHATSRKVKDDRGNEWGIHIRLKGSSEMNTEEFARLIDGVRSELAEGERC